MAVPFENARQYSSLASAQKAVRAGACNYAVVQHGQGRSVWCHVVCKDHTGMVTLKATFHLVVEPKPRKVLWPSLTKSASLPHARVNLSASEILEVLNRPLRPPQRPSHVSYP